MILQCFIILFSCNLPYIVWLCVLQVKQCSVGAAALVHSSLCPRQLALDSAAEYLHCSATDSASVHTAQTWCCPFINFHYQPHHHPKNHHMSHDQRLYQDVNDLWQKQLFLGVGCGCESR